jgi:hypothetical protein
VKAAIAALALALVTAVPAGAASFNPVEFFRGRTHGEGMLKIIFQSAKKMTVDSEGRAEKDGTLVLEQIVHEPGKAPRTRYWRMKQMGPNRFEGTLTDAAGPVRVDVAGERIRIRYRGKDHLDFDQWLTPAGSKQVNNRMRVKRFGIIVARYDEVIRKLD